MATHELFAYLHVDDAGKAIDFYWNIVGHSIEEVDPEEMQRRYNELMGGQ